MSDHFFPFEVSEDALQDSLEILSKHTDEANNGRAFLKGTHARYSGDYSKLSMKRSFLKDCACEDADFDSVAFTGSQFQEVTFSGCNFANASIDFTLFYRCKLASDTGKTELLNSNLTNSNIISCTLAEVDVCKSVLSNSLFKNTTFSKCSIQYSTFENTSFHHCRFVDMELRDLNLDFSEFLYPTFENVVLPFSQVPYTFGLLQSLREAGRNIWISSKQNNGKISVSQYFDLLPDCINRYISQREYFPLANIYIAQGKHNMAFQAILSGIKKAGYEKDFRMLKYFCKLARLSSSCNQEALHLLYDYIYDYRHFEPMEPFEMRNYFLYLGEIRNILIADNSNSPTLYFRIQSNICPEEKDSLTLLLESIDQLIGGVPDQPIVNKVELRHNSPYEILIIAIGALAALKLLAEGLSTLCKPIKDFKDIQILNQTIKLNQQKLELGQQQLQLNKAKLQEIEKTAEKKRIILAKNNISLDSSYYFINDDHQSQ